MPARLSLAIRELRCPRSPIEGANPSLSAIESADLIDLYEISVKTSATVPKSVPKRCALTGFYFAGAGPQIRA